MDIRPGRRAALAARKNANDWEMTGNVLFRQWVDCCACSVYVADMSRSTVHDRGSSSGSTNAAVSATLSEPDNSLMSLYMRKIRNLYNMHITSSTAVVLLLIGFGQRVSVAMLHDELALVEDACLLSY